MLTSRLLRTLWPGHPTHWLDVPGRLLPFAVSVVRLSTAAVIAYLLTLLADDSGPIDLTGPLTALLVLQASAVSTVRMGLVRVGAVLAGVLIAGLLSTWIGLTWWSLGAAIAAAIIAARLLRLREQMLEAPISAMLILGVTNHEIAAEIRILNTFIGAGVGMAIGLLFPAAVAAAAVVGSVERAADAVAAPLDAAADTLRREPPTRAQARGWLDQARDAAAELVSVNRAVSALRERRRWNHRALATADVVPLLDSAVDTFDRCLLAVRALFSTILADLPEDDRQPEERLGEDLRQIFAVVLTQTADSLRAFGDLVVAEAEGREREAEAALARSLEYAGETRAMLTELLLTDPAGTRSWLLRGSLLAALDHVLAELRLENRDRARQALRAQRLPAVVEGVLSHPDRPYPRVVDRALDRRRTPRPEQAPDRPSA